MISQISKIENPKEEKFQENSNLNNSQNFLLNPNNYLLDLSCGILSGLFISPIVAIIDKAICQNASGSSKLFTSIDNSLNSIRKSPRNLLNVEFRYMFLIYTGTYSSSNIIDSFCKKNKIKSELPKLIGISCINTFLAFTKDRAFVKLFGTIKPKKIPLKTYSMWSSRDALTMTCAFIAPNKLAGFLQKSKKWSKGKSEKIAQLFCPIFLQFFSTPLHLLGLNYYNSEKKDFIKRLRFVKREYFKSVGARMITIFPAYGIGGILNNSFRNFIKDE